MEKPEKIFDASFLKAACPLGLIPRCKIRELTTGAVSEKTMANLDSAGEGPAGAFRIGGKVVYPVDSFIAWIEGRARPIERRPRKNMEELLA